MSIQDSVPISLTTRDGVPISLTARDRVIINQLPTGVRGLDEVLGGGLPEYSFNLIAGAPGTGKTTLSQQLMFALATPQRPALHFTVMGEPSLKLLRYQLELAPNLERMLRQGLLEIIYLRPLDLSVDEALLEIQAAVKRTSAQRLVIDSLSGFELALAPTFREDFRESLYRMVGALTGSGVTVFMTTEVAQSFTDLRFSTDLISFLTDDVIVQRYVEIEGQIRKVMMVIKMRGSKHSKDLRPYDVTETGLEVGDSLYEYRGIITGVAQRYQLTEAGTSA